MEKGREINQIVKGKVWVDRSVPPSLREKIFELAELHFTILKREAERVIDQVPFLDIAPPRQDG